MTDLAAGVGTRSLRVERSTGAEHSAMLDSTNVYELNPSARNDSGSSVSLSRNLHLVPASQGWYRDSQCVHQHLSYIQRHTKGHAQQPHITSPATSLVPGKDLAIRREDPPLVGGSLPLAVPDAERLAVVG
jgi:hypothetical protein